MMCVCGCGALSLPVSGDAERQSERSGDASIGMPASDAGEVSTDGGDLGRDTGGLGAWEDMSLSLPTTQATPC